MSEFVVESGKLTVRTDLAEERVDEFDAACTRMRDETDGDFVVDMTGVGYMCSRAVGVLATLWMDLAMSGRRFRIVPSPQVKRLLDMGGLTTVFNLMPGK